MTPAALRALMDGEKENFIAAMTPGGIEAQEKQGQLSMAGRPGKLPIKGTSSPEDRARWESLGFVFSDEGDALWVEVVFPPGWTVVPTDHSMWSNILDAQGRKRAVMFYKAAFYDQKAHVTLERRYSVGRDYDRKDCCPFGLWDAGKMVEVWETLPASDAQNFSALDATARRCEVKLKERFPDHEDPMAYWS